MSPPSSRSSPQKVRKTFAKVHILSTVETGITAGQSVMSPIVTGTHLCGETPTRNRGTPGHKPLTWASDPLAARSPTNIGAVACRKRKDDHQCSPSSADWRALAHVV